jgi:hypothetical protein
MYGGHMLERTRTAACLLLACLAGIGTSVAVASSPGRGGGDDDDTTTEDTTTGTTDDTTGGTTGTTTTTTTGPTGGPPRAPRIVEIEVDALRGDRLRLRAEIQPRGARVTRVRFTYRKRTFAARHVRGKLWARTVQARGGDGDDVVVTVKVRACAGSRCATRTGRDDG